MSDTVWFRREQSNHGSDGGDGLELVEDPTIRMSTIVPVIELINVEKDYVSAAGTVSALRGVNLSIVRGEFVAIVGTSGSGKSTLMNILGCLDRPTRGTYTLAGLDIGSRTNDGRAVVRNRLIGFIFQGFNLLSRTTALENVELPLRYRGYSAEERRRDATAALEKVGLGGRFHHAPNQLSGGQQQRVAIARALVTNPPLLLADEPTGNLDTRTSLEVLALLQELNRSGITICLVTHEPDIAACASRVITVRDGHIVSDVAQRAPVDAAAALAALPPVRDYGPSPAARRVRDSSSPSAHLGGPVPLSVYSSMPLGAAIGLVVGMLYTTFVLGHVLWPFAAIAGALGGPLLGARYGRRKVRLTTDQKVRLALAHAVVLSIAAAMATLAIPGFVPTALLDRIERLSSAMPTGVLALGFLVFSAATLLHYVLLSLFAADAPARPRAIKRAV